MFIKSSYTILLRARAKVVRDMDKYTRITVLLFTLPIILMSQISSSFALYPFTKTITASGVINEKVVEPTRIRKHVVAYAPLTDEAVNFVASHFDVVVADFVYTKGFEKIKAVNPNVTLLGYRDIMAMHTTYEDWPEVNSHEDWFLHDVDGNRLIHKGYGWYAMDVGNSGWRSHYSNFVKAKLDIYPTVDGMFADDVWEWRDRHNTVWTVDPSLVHPEIQQRWHNDMVGMLQHLKSVIGNKLVIINTNEMSGDYLQNTDGMMWEGFIHGGWEGLDDFWQDPFYQLEVLSRLSATGKYFLAQSGAKIPDNPTQTDLEKAHKIAVYCLASALLASNGLGVSFGWNSILSKDGSQGYYAEMDYDTGAPLGDYYVKDGLYIRDFEYARVLVNFDSASTHSTVIEGTTYTLEPHSGIIVGK